MARQTGIIKLKGTIGGITFYKSIDGSMAREKGGVDGKRIASDPAFARTRENGAEFGRAAKAGKLLRDTFSRAVSSGADPRLTARLTKEMVKVVKADAFGARGQRQILDAELELLTGFDFNINGKLATSYLAGYYDTINKVTGEVVFDLIDLIPINSVQAPGGTTHIKFNFAVAAFDFENSLSTIKFDSSELVPLDSTYINSLKMTVTVPEIATRPSFLAFGLEFFQKVNNKYYSLKNGAYNCLNLVKFFWNDPEANP